MIEPLDSSEIEDGISAYLLATAEFAALRVPPENPRNAASPPDLVALIDKQELDAKRITVMVTIPTLETEVPGYYEAALHLWVVTPANVQANTREHHKAVVKALGKAFPNRPSPGSEDLAAWLAIEALVSASVEAKCGWEVHGWFASSGSATKSNDRWEQRVTVTMGLNHPSVSGRE